MLDGMIKGNMKATRFSLDLVYRYRVLFIIFLSRPVRHRKENRRTSQTGFCKSKLKKNIVNSANLFLFNLEQRKRDEDDEVGERGRG